MSSALSKMTLVLAFGAVIVTGCSNQYRTVKASPDEEEVFTALEEFVSTSSGGGIFSELATAEDTVVYFAQGPEMGPPESILAMRDYGFLDLVSPEPDQEFDSRDLEMARVFFLDGFVGDVRQFALAIETKVADGDSQIVVFETADDQWSFKNGQFVAQMAGSGPLIEVYSFDIVPGSKDELAEVIQLRVAEFTDDSGESALENGKINNLVGYGRGR